MPYPFSKSLHNFLASEAKYEDKLLPPKLIILTIRSEFNTLYVKVHNTAIRLRPNK